MAKFELEIPREIMQNLRELEENTPKMMEEMTQAGAKVVSKNISNNIRGSFKDPSGLLKHLKVTKAYRTPSDGRSKY